MRKPTASSFVVWFVVVVVGFFLVVATKQQRETRRPSQAHNHNHTPRASPFLSFPLHCPFLLRRRCCGFSLLSFFLLSPLFIVGLVGFVLEGVALSTNRTKPFLFSFLFLTNKQTKRKEERRANNNHDDATLKGRHRQRAGLLLLLLASFRFAISSFSSFFFSFFPPEQQDLLKTMPSSSFSLLISLVVVFRRRPFPSNNLVLHSVPSLFFFCFSFFFSFPFFECKTNTKRKRKRKRNVKRSSKQQQQKGRTRGTIREKKEEEEEKRRGWRHHDDDMHKGFFPSLFLFSPFPFASLPPFSNCTTKRFFIHQRLVVVVFLDSFPFHFGSELKTKTKRASPSLPFDLNWWFDLERNSKRVEEQQQRE